MTTRGKHAPKQSGVKAPLCNCCLRGGDIVLPETHNEDCNTCKGSAYLEWSPQGKDFSSLSPGVIPSLPVPHSCHALIVYKVRIIKKKLKKKNVASNTGKNIN